MKNRTSILLIALVISILLPACKYEEGPKISFRSKTSRVVNIWKVESVTKNGLDVTATYQSLQPGLVVEFKDDGFVVYTWDQGGSPMSYSEAWDFNSDKSALNITDGAVTQEWEILRLKNDEMWLKTTIPTSLGSSIQEIHYATK